MGTKVVLVLLLVEAVVGARKLRPRKETVQRLRRDFGRSARQLGETGVPGGIDFSNAVFDEETGKRCVLKEESVQSLEKEPILECVHKNTEQCHYTYITTFKPSQEEVCDENFEKSCQVTFKQQAVNETVRKCYKPVEKICDGQGETICQTIFETSCTTKYIEKQPGKFVGDTSCEKLPIEICGAGCTAVEGDEECHQKLVVSLVDIPEEVCDLNPQKICRFQTKLVPSLVPKHECTVVPRETCNLKFKTPRRIDKPLLTKWCLDDSPILSGELYDESDQEEERSLSGRPLPLTQSLLGLSNPKGSRITVQSLSVPETEARRIDFDQPEQTLFNQNQLPVNDVSQKLVVVHDELNLEELDQAVPHSVQEEDDALESLDLGRREEPLLVQVEQTTSDGSITPPVDQVPNQLPLSVSNQLPLSVSNQLPLQLPNQVPLQLPNQLPLFPLVDTEDNEENEIDINHQYDEENPDIIEDFDFPEENISTFVLPVTDSENEADVIRELVAQEGPDGNLVENVAANNDGVQPEDAPASEEADLFSARPISILSSAPDDQSDFTNFKTQEFEDFIDFSVYRL